MTPTSMDLILIRHAVAHERDSGRWPDDALRPLTDRGALEFRRFAKRLGRLAGEVDVVESSSFVRAWETARILRDAAAWPKPTRAERLEPAEQDDSAGGTHAADARLEALARSIVAMRGLRSVAWVGHEPILSRLASLLLAGSPDAISIDFRKGAAIALRFEALTPDPTSAIGRARLRWMLSQRAARRIAGD